MGYRQDAQWFVQKEKVNSVTYNSDCLASMRAMPDKAFDLAIVDPPFGWGDEMFLNRPTSSKRENKLGIKYAHRVWNDDPPTPEYFTELFRVSVNQIVWGGNYFTLPVSRGWIFWDKQFEFTHTFSAGELAWTSFDKILKKFTLSSKAETNGGIDKIHINQKPVALYKWLLTNYAKQGDTILDSHLGSGSSRIAAYDLGFDFTAFELDHDYWLAQEERFARHIAQPQLFEIPRAEPIQEAMFAAA